MSLGIIFRLELPLTYLIQFISNILIQNICSRVVSSSPKIGWLIITWGMVNKGNQTSL